MGWKPGWLRGVIFVHCCCHFSKSCWGGHIVGSRARPLRWISLLHSVQQWNVFRILSPVFLKAVLAHTRCAFNTDSTERPRKRRINSGQRRRSEHCAEQGPKWRTDGQVISDWVLLLSYFRSFVMCLLERNSSHYCDYNQCDNLSNYVSFVRNHKP